MISPAHRRTACVRVARQAMACEFSLFVPARPGAVEAACSALDEVDRLEERLSIFLPDSDISQVNNRAAHEAVKVEPCVTSVLARAARLSAGTGGAFDAASGALVKAWGFEGGERQVPAQAVILSALKKSGMRHVLVSESDATVRFGRDGIRINLGGIGKGFAIDRALETARIQSGPGAVLMQGGQSSLKGLGAPPGEQRGWKVAIGDPFRPGRVVASVRLRDRALGTSSSANQFFRVDGRRYGHILDPRTGYPAACLASASALAPSAADADALSTAFFVMGVEGTREYCRNHPGIAALLVTPLSEGGRAQVIATGFKEGEIDLPKEATRE